MIPNPASLFGRYEFVVRRFHSLTGLLPIGGYLAFHLWTNASVWDGAAAYQYRANQIHDLGETSVLYLEWGLIFLPILFHGLVGLFIVARGKRNMFQYAYEENVRYTFQRGSGVVAFLFIIWHVFQMHGWFKFAWWQTHVAEPLGGALFVWDNGPATAAAVIQSSGLMAGLYVIGVVACVYHLAHGLWTAGITWGVWTSPHSQRIARHFCTAVGLVLLVVGGAALWGMEAVPVRHASTGPALAADPAR